MHKAKRLFSKQRGTVQCSTCNSKATMLWKGFGSWPTFEFKSLPEDAQVQFWNEIQGKSGLKELIATVENYVEGYEKKEEVYANNGEFRPLKFWEINGYDTERILNEAKTDDIRETRLAGLCYRVPVEVTSKVTTVGRKRTEGIHAQGQKRKYNNLGDFLKKAPAQETKEAEKDDDDEGSQKRSSSNSSSSSSSSSSTDKKSKQKKKDQKKKEKRMKKQKKKEKKEKKEAKKMQGAEKSQRSY